MVFEDRTGHSQRHGMFYQKKIKKRKYSESSHSSVEHSKYKVCCQFVHCTVVGLIFPQK